MAVFVDTGVLLRATHRSDPTYSEIRGALRVLYQQGTPVFTGLQQLAEFWNVCTRPPGLRGGFDLSLDVTARRLQRIRRGVKIVTETPLTPDIWASLVQRHGVRGVQVHDARTVALMITHSLRDLLTLNKQDFTRYRDEGIVPVSPSEFVATSR